MVCSYLKFWCLPVLLWGSSDIQVAVGIKPALFLGKCMCFRGFHQDLMVNMEAPIWSVCDLAV